MDLDYYKEYAEVEDKHWWFVGRRLILKNVLNKYIPLNPIEKPELLDIGSGTGGNLSLLLEYGEVTAVEMDSQAIEFIHKKQLPGLSNVQQGSLPSDLGVQGEFGFITAFDVIEHIDDDETSLVKIKKLLSENGLLILTVPAYQWLWSSHDEINHHYRRYTKNKLDKLLEKSGYELLYTSYFNTLLFPLAVLQRLFSKFRDSEPNSEDNLAVPNNLINSLLLQIFSLERFWISKIVAPFGLSIVAVAKPISDKSNKTGEESIE